VDDGITMTITVPSPTGTAAEPITITSGVLMHEAWHISWRAADASSLTPSLPALTSGVSYSVWVPGQSETAAPRSGQGVDHSWDGVRRFLMIGLPIIIVGLAAAVVGCVLAARRAGKREQARELAAVGVVVG
jgi:hypothetical protein